MVGVIRTKIMNRHKLNVPGDFYVQDGECMSCMLPEEMAPELMGYFEEGNAGHCYFRKQPESQIEIDNAVLAIDVSCCGAVRYCGKNKDILKTLKRLNLKGQIDT